MLAIVAETVGSESVTDSSTTLTELHGTNFSVAEVAWVGALDGGDNAGSGLAGLL